MMVVKIKQINDNVKKKIKNTITSINKLLCKGTAHQIWQLSFIILQIKSLLGNDIKSRTTVTNVS